MIPEELLSAITQQLHFKLNKLVSVRKSVPVGGGCINEAVKLETDRGIFFVKYNHADKFPQMFAREAEGLDELRETGAIHIPEVILHSEAGKYAFLILEFIEAEHAAKDFWHNFGQSLAALHRNSSETFCFRSDNYIGSLPQSNKAEKDFCSFFINRRLLPQIKAARDAQHLSSAHVSAFENLFTRLQSIIPEEKPALIHGDLWYGNFMVNAAGNACIFDPAVSYSHREADLAMTKLFGGFSPEFYISYNTAFPPEKAWQERTDIFNLYPLLVHVNLFGFSYVQDVLRIIGPFRR